MSPGGVRGARAAAALVILLAACGRGGEPGPPPEWREEGGHRWRPLRGADGREEPGFTALSAGRTGVRFSNRLPTEEAVRNQNLANGSGVALGDVDGDGRVDLYLARLHGPNALYRNLGGWRFEEGAEEAGVAVPGAFSTGALLGDAEGDGDLDLFVAVFGGRNRLFLNDGGGSFTDATEGSGLEGELGSTTLALADVDVDGDLDLYVANYKTRSARDIYPPAELTFRSVVRRGPDGYEVAPRFREHFGLRWEGRELKRYELAEPDRLYLNDGEGRFRAVSFTGGRFLDEEGRPLETTPREWALAARFQDVDRDGDPDLFVANDLHSPDHFWINQGDGTFRAIPRLAIRTTSNSTMALDFSDVDRDGDVDFFEADMLSRSSRLRKSQKPTMSVVPTLPGEIATRPQRPRNAFFLNRGDGTYAEIAHYAGLEASEWTWGTLFLDVDLDGHEDLLITNGHLWDLMDRDTRRRVDRMVGDEDWRRRVLQFPGLRTRNLAFRNRGDATFEEVGEAWGFSAGPDVSHGLAAADLDRDGDLDVVVNRLGEPALLLRNDATAPRLRVRLRGRPPNTAGVGARVRLIGGPVEEQRQEVSAGGLYLSSSDPAVTFAASPEAGMTLVVDWRSGARSVVRGVRAGREYEVRAGGSGAPATDSSPGRVETAAARDTLGAASEESAARSGETYFEDATAALGHRHIERLYDDFRRQPLLPFRLSQPGPGVTWHDLDRDGDPDLVVGTGRGGVLSALRNEGGEFRPVELDVPPPPVDQTTVLALPGTEETARLLVGQSAYEAPPRRSERVPAVVRLDLPRSGAGRAGSSTRTEAAVPGSRGAAGPLALADYDLDGDLDLFVGGRVVPGAYPAPASSRLLLNEGDGRFTPDRRNEGLLEEVGVVSSAVFSDVDADGDPDLLLAREWASLKLYLNDGGRFRDATGEWELEAPAARWLGIASGDLDEDGRPEVVATSWGLNSAWRATPERPLWIYHGDLDRNGSVEVIPAREDERLDALAPLVDLARLRPALPSVRTRMGSFAEYADASLEEVLGPRLPRAKRAGATTLAHTLFLNRGGRFEPRRLPPEAQFAPAHAAVVADFDGDGHEDVFLSQNFFATDMDTPRLDAGRGLWLRGDGGGGLEPVPGHVTGVEVYGDQRGAAVADYDGDGRVDLAVSQNGAATKLYRNRRARRGLRVRLRGPPSNPDGIGAVLRVLYERGGAGPAREVQAGSGYWSANGPVQVLGLAGEPRAVRVRWPGADARTVPVPAGARELEVRPPRP